MKNEIDLRIYEELKDINLKKLIGIRKKSIKNFVPPSSEHEKFLMKKGFIFLDWGYNNSKDVLPKTNFICPVKYF
jgi:hypothetical protein